LIQKIYAVLRIRRTNPDDFTNVKTRVMRHLFEPGSPECHSEEKNTVKI